jgi:transposase InsO family protein
VLGVSSSGFYAWSQRPAPRQAERNDALVVHIQAAYRASRRTYGAPRIHLDNAVAESFFHTLKTELVYQHRYRTREEARLAIFEYIAAFYNRTRRHSRNDYRSPDQQEAAYGAGSS